MAEIRINKIIKQFNIGLGDLVEFLRKQGADIDENPNAKISDEYLPSIEKQFGKDLEAKKAAEKVDIHLTEILEKTGRKPAKEEEEEETEKETVIKSNTFINAKKAQPVQAEPEAPAAPEKPVEEPAKPVEEPVKPAEPEKEEKPAEPAKPEPVAEPEPVKAEKPVEPAKPVKEPEKPAEPEEAAEPVEEPAEPADPEKAAEPVAEPAKPAEEPAPAEEKKDASPFKVVGKVDLSQFERKPVKRERINKGMQKVDVAKAGANIDRNAGKKDNKQKPQQNQPQPGQGKRKRDRDRFKPAMTEAEQEEMQKEIQKQVKETYAKMNGEPKQTSGKQELYETIVNMYI